MRLPVPGLVGALSPFPVLLLLAGLLLACFLDGSVEGPPIGTSYVLEAEVAPQLICPADPVEVSWTVRSTYEPYGACTSDDADCVYPLGMRASTSPPDLFAASPVAETELSGSRTLNPETSTTVDLIGTRGDGAEGTATITRTFPIEVVEDLEQERMATAAGRCDGTSPAFDALQVGSAATLGTSVVFNRMCLPGGSPYPAVRVEVYYDGAPTPAVYTINRGECTDLRVEAGDRMNRVLVRPEPFTFPPTVSCPGGTTSTSEERPPDDLQLLVALACQVPEG